MSLFKRIVLTLLVGILLGLVSGIFLIVWQPAFFQTWVLKTLVRQVNRRTPYTVSVDHMMGDWFKTLSLQGISFIANGASPPLFEASAIRLNFGWKALLRGQVKFHRVEVVDPVIRAAINKEGRLTAVVPGPIDAYADRDAETTSGRSGWPVYIDQLEIHDGDVVVRKATTGQSLDLVLPDLRAAISPSRLEIRHLEAHLGQGTLAGHGSVALKADTQGADLTLHTQEFPFEQLLAFGPLLRPRLKLVHTGDWIVTSHHQTWAIKTQGVLNDAPLDAYVEWTAKGSYSARVDLTGLSLDRTLAQDHRHELGRIWASLRASAPSLPSRHITVHGGLHVSRYLKEQRPRQTVGLHLGLNEGLGPIALAVNIPGNVVVATLHLDVPGRKVHGRYDMNVQNLAGISEFLPDTPLQGSLDAAGGIQGSMDGPEITAVVHGRNLRFGRWPRKGGADLDYAGSFQPSGKTWQLQWDHLALRPPQGMSIRAARPGSVRRMADGTLQMEDVLFESGMGRLHVDQAILRPPHIQMSLTAEVPDMGKLTNLMPDLTVDQGGFMRLKARVKGNINSTLETNGMLEAHIPHAEVKKAGLELHNLRADILIQDNEVRIRQFSSQVGEGTLQVTGQSRLPVLRFQLEAKKMDIKIPEQIEGQADARLTLAGSLTAPDLSGSVHLDHGTYTAPPSSVKKKEKAEVVSAVDEKPVEFQASSSASLHSRLDVRVRWPRNVWYRDGVSKIETSGDLRIEKKNGETKPYLTGSISLLRGTYSAYGRDFNVDSGDIAFTGPPEINPVLNIEATYKSGGTTVYLDLKGTAKAPELKLRSNPPLADQDIVSVLILGQPLNRISASGGAETSKEAQAKALAGSVLGNMVTKELRTKGLDLGLDVVRVEPTAEGGTRLKIGRYIGPDLFVSYGQPIQSSAVQTFEADYYISPYWTLKAKEGAVDSPQVNTTTDRHLGIEFRFPLNEPEYPRR